MWGAYPSDRPSQAAHKEDVQDSKGNIIAKKGDLLYDNQCAIKVSVAIHGAGVEMKSFRGAATAVNGKKTAIRAAELAEWLKKQPFCGLPMKPVNIVGNDWQNKIKGKTGIVFFSNYWKREGQKHLDGDHIDLWNGSRLTSSGLRGAMTSFARFTLRLNTLWYSDLGASSEILFWEIK